MVGLVGLEKNVSGVEMAAADATDDLSDEVKGALFGGEIGKGKIGIGLDDADSGETGKIETFCDGLSADDDVD